MSRYERMYNRLLIGSLALLAIAVALAARTDFDSPPFADLPIYAPFAIPVVLVALLTVFSVGAIGWIYSDQIGACHRVIRYWVPMTIGSPGLFILLSGIADKVLSL